MKMLRIMLGAMSVAVLAGCASFNPMSLLGGTDIALDGENVKAEAGQHNDTELRLANGWGVIAPIPFSSLPTISTAAVVSVDADSITIDTPTEVVVDIPTVTNLAAAVASTVSNAVAPVVVATPTP
jgi:hypothetical protein